MLKDGFLDLMQQKPIQQITVKELCDHVDLNRGTFYLHYRDMYDLLDHIESEILEQFNEIIHAYSPEESNGKPSLLLKAGLCRWVIIYLGHPLPEGSSDLPESTTGSRMAFYSVLLRMEFTCARPVTRAAVVSYTAFPPLPQQMRRFISVALVWELPPPDVIRHPALRSPDFPRYFFILGNHAVMAAYNHNTHRLSLIPFSCFDSCSCNRHDLYLSHKSSLHSCSQYILFHSFRLDHIVNRTSDCQNQNSQNNCIRHIHFLLFFMCEGCTVP